MDRNPMTKGEAEAIVSVLKAIDRSAKIEYVDRETGWTVVTAH